MNHEQMHQNENESRDSLVEIDPQQIREYTDAVKSFGGTFTQCAKTLDRDMNHQKRQRVKEQPTKAEERAMQHEVDELGRGPLGGKAFCCSGVFENITREKLEYFIKQNDGRLVSSVSSKTNFLVIGKILDDNRPVTQGGKYLAAVKHGTKIMTEKEFELFCRQKFENPDFLLGRKTKKDTTERAEDMFVSNGQPANKDNIADVLDIGDLLDSHADLQMKTPLTTVSTPQKIMPQPSRTKSTGPPVSSIFTGKKDVGFQERDKNFSGFWHKLAKPPSISKAADNTQKPVKTSEYWSWAQKYSTEKPTTPNDYWTANNKAVAEQLEVPQDSKADGQLWVERYTPKKAEDLVGNQSQFKEVREWLADWYGLQSGKIQKKQPKIDHRKKDRPVNDPNARALLISGPPGIGKTTTVRMLAKLLGFEMLELNASDARNKAQIEQLLDNLSQSELGIKSSLAHQQAVANKKGTPSKQKKTLILMDEVDGVGQGDRGGLGALLLIIKKTRVPIILICNDRGDRRIQSLLNQSYDIKFTQATSRQIFERIKLIADKEGFEVDQSQIDRMVQSSGSDIRQIINSLQFQYQAAKPNQIPIDKIQKDQVQMMNNFDAALKLLTPNKNMKIKDRMDIYWLDWQLIPLFVQMNYIDASRDIFEIVQAADYISCADMVNSQIKCQQWGLLPEVGILGCCAPSLILTGKSLFIKFPEIWPKMSITNKTKRMLREIKASCGVAFQADRQSFLHQYVPLIYQLVVGKLETGCKEQITQAVEILINQGMSADMFKEHVLTLLMDSSADRFNAIDSKVKTAFTKSYNQLCSSSVKRLKKKAIPEAKVNGYKQGFDPQYMDSAEEADGSDEELNSDNEFEVVGKTKEVKQLPAPKASGKATSEMLSRGRGRGIRGVRGGSK